MFLTRAAGEPVHSCAFLTTGLMWPAWSQSAQAWRAAVQLAQRRTRLWRAIWGHGHLVLGATYVATRSSEVQRRQSSGRDQWAVGTSRVFYGRWASSSFRCASRAVQERGPARVRIRMRVSQTGSRPSVQKDEGPATTQGTARHRRPANQRA